jgi:hypothetical protein
MVPKLPMQPVPLLLTGAGATVLLHPDVLGYQLHDWTATYCICLQGVLGDDSDAVSGAIKIKPNTWHFVTVLFGISTAVILLSLPALFSF